MRHLVILCSFSLLFFPCSCQKNDDEIRTYRVSKETGPVMPMAGGPMMGSAPTAGNDMGLQPAASSRDVEWDVPSGWKEQPPSSMRIGSFLAKGSDGSQADISVVPLSGEAGGDLANVNRWRGQINLGPITETDLPQNSQQITPGGRPMLLVDFTGEGNKRLVAATYKSGGKTWFFKMTGSHQAVEDVKPAFLQFLKTLRFHGNS